MVARIDAVGGIGYTYKDLGAIVIGAPDYPEIPLTESMLHPIATETTEGSVAGLCDGITYDDASDTWFWHSPWSFAGSYDPEYGIYIDIDLGASKKVQDFALYFCLRPVFNDHAKHARVYGSNDQSSWGAVLAEQTDIYNAAKKDEYGMVAVDQWTAPFKCHAPAPVRYIRLAILSTDGGTVDGKDLTDPSAAGCTHIAEMKLFGK